MGKSAEPLFAPALAQAVISIAAIFGLKNLDLSDREGLTAVIVLLWGAVAAALEWYKRSRVTPVEKSAENVREAARAQGVAPNTAALLAKTVRKGEVVR